MGQHTKEGVIGGRETRAKWYAGFFSFVSVRLTTTLTLFDMAEITQRGITQTTHVGVFRARDPLHVYLVLGVDTERNGEGLNTVKFRI